MVRHLVDQSEAVECMNLPIFSEPRSENWFTQKNLKKQVLVEYLTFLL